MERESQKGQGKSGSIELPLPEGHWNISPEEYRRELVFFWVFVAVMVVLIAGVLGTAYMRYPGHITPVRKERSMLEKSVEPKELAVLLRRVLPATEGSRFELYHVGSHAWCSIDLVAQADSMAEVPELMLEAQRVLEAVRKELPECRVEGEASVGRLPFSLEVASTMADQTKIAVRLRLELIDPQRQRELESEMRKAVGPIFGPTAGKFAGL